MGGCGMTLPDVDPARLAQEWAEDREVLASLAENGDKAELVRSIDVSFLGSDADLDRLADDAESLGFTVLEREETEDGDMALFLARAQTVDSDAIKALTLQCLQIEILYDVDYEGWGCMAQTGSAE